MTGESRHPSASLLQQALIEAEEGSTGEIRVHLSRRPFEPNALKRATRLFDRFGMNRTAQRNAVLLYVNLRKHRFAIVADRGFSQAVEPMVWDRIAAELSDHFRSTHPDRAMAIAIIRIGVQLQKHFPAHLEKGTQS